jgi:hypothetical protein
MSVRLRPWREVVKPHQDVLENRFSQSEFAADLTAVELGRATPEYQDPARFFAISFLTEGMKRVLTLAAERLSGKGGEPVIGLQTAFGGGKSHTMLALRHLAAAPEPIPVAGIPPVADRQPARIVALVGTGLGARQRLSRDSEPALYTPWGLMAWRLAGQAGLSILQEAEAMRAPPGTERLLVLLERTGPCLILLDELVAYARVLDENDLAAFLSFIQSLTEACKIARNALVVGSLIESDEEAGNERGVKIRRQLEKIFGRLQSPWLPTQAHEQVEIVRRRLFQESDETARAERDATVAGFAEFYRRNARAFPAEAAEAGYRTAMLRAYPMHPELFRLFADVWSGLANERFQQTRGVLRLMAAVVRALWHNGDPSPLILPGSLPLADSGVRAALLEPIDPRLAVVLAQEVEGDAARPSVIEAKRRSYASAWAVTRAARAVFLATAPGLVQSVAGVTGPRLRLSCAQPGEQIDMFGDALRELAESSAYLHREDERYWFSTTPTLNQLASEIAADLEAPAAEAKLAELLAGETSGSRFARVHVAAGRDPTMVDDSRALGLVILDSRNPHAGRDAQETPATRLASEILERRGSGQRQYRNTLLFAAADEARLEDARWAVRRLIVWSMILSRSDGELRLTPMQQSEVRRRRDDLFGAARRAVRAAWSHLLVPTWPEGDDAVGSGWYKLHQAPIYNHDGQTRIAEAAFARAARDGSIVVEKLGGANLKLLLDRVIGDQPHVSVRDLTDWSARFLHMKRLHTESLLAGAIEELIGSPDCAYAWADGFDRITGAYLGLRLGRVLFPEVRGNGVLVRLEVARGQADRAKGMGGVGEPVPELLVPRTRFFGTVTVDPTRPGTQVKRITDAVVSELVRAGDTKVSMTLDIAVERDQGFSEDIVSSVTESAALLKFQESGFE